MLFICLEGNLASSSTGAGMESINVITNALGGSGGGHQRPVSVREMMRRATAAAAVAAAARPSGW